MNPLALIAIALLTLLVGIGYAVLIFRADARRTRETELAAFQHTAPVGKPTLAPTIRKLERDQRLAFAGKVKQQIRVIPLSPPTNSNR